MSEEVGALQRTQNIKALRVLDTALNKGLLFKLRVDKDKQQKKELHLSVDFVYFALKLFKNKFKHLKRSTLFRRSGSTVCSHTQLSGNQFK